MESSIVLKSYGRLYNPTGNWGYYPHYLANRFYYICSGTVHFKDKLQLKPGFIYLFKSDSEFKVSQSDSDPIDHVYFDFISSGQMIDKEYVEIDPDKYPAASFKGCNFDNMSIFYINIGYECRGAFKISSTFRNFDILALEK